MYKYNLMNSISVACMYVFKLDHLVQDHQVETHFTGLLDKMYLPGRMISSYFRWNQHMASHLLILWLAPMQLVLCLLSALLKPGLPGNTQKCRL